MEGLEAAREAEAGVRDHAKDGPSASPGPGKLGGGGLALLQ